MYQEEPLSIGSAARGTPTGEDKKRGTQPDGETNSLDAQLSARPWKSHASRWSCPVWLGWGQEKRTNRVTCLSSFAMP